MQTEVRTTIENHLGVVTLTREKALNSLTHNMIHTIHRYADAWSKKEDIAFLLFPPLQQKVYCAGGDIRWLYDNGKSAKHEKQMAFFADEYRLDYAIGTYNKPVIAIVDGFLIGGGMGLLMPVQTLYGTESASFAMPETGIGFFPDVGMSYRLSQCPGKAGLYLALTGQRINAHEAKYLGLIKGVLSDVEALKISNIARDSKDEVNLYHTVSQLLTENTITAEHVPIAEHQQQIDEVFSGNSVQEIIDSLATLSGSWAEQTLKQLQNACPLSLRITFDLIHRVSAHNQAYSYQLDHAVAYHFMRSLDFYEGVRAQIIDKDRKPNWQYKHVDDVPQSVVDKFFVLPEVPLDLTYHIHESVIATDH